jgi:hypothetical protein
MLQQDTHPDHVGLPIQQERIQRTTIVTGTCHSGWCEQKNGTNRDGGGPTRSNHRQGPSRAGLWFLLEGLWDWKLDTGHTTHILILRDRL